MNTKFYKNCIKIIRLKNTKNSLQNIKQSITKFRSINFKKIKKYNVMSKKLEEVFYKKNFFFVEWVKSIKKKIKKNKIKWKDRDIND